MYVYINYFLRLPRHHLGVNHSLCLSVSLSLSWCDGFLSSQQFGYLNNCFLLIDVFIASPLGKYVFVSSDCSENV
jgi:hypothetical protein